MTQTQILNLKLRIDHHVLLVFLTPTKRYNKRTKGLWMAFIQYDLDTC